MLTKREIIQALGSQAGIARILGLTRGAVTQWPMDAPIPEYRELQLRALYPEKFGDPRSMVQARFRPARKTTSNDRATL